MSTKHKILFLVNDLGFFISHRLPIALEAKKNGFEVVVAYGVIGRAKLSTFYSHGIDTFNIPLKCSSLNPFYELLSLFYIWKLFRNIKPHIVHLITMKPYLYGGIIARVCNIPAVVSAVTGLGSIFIQDNFKNYMLRFLLFPFFHFALGHKNQVIILQNQNDGNLLVKLGMLKQNKICLLRGSGVDLSKFTNLNNLSAIPIVSFAGRLLRDKGIFEFVNAAYMLFARGITAKFWVIGDIDSHNPTSISKQELYNLKQDNIVEFLGYRKNIMELYTASHIICLPSYREGLPKSLIEAAAAGRAVVTTDVPGCRDAIIPNKTGILVPVKDVEKLADAIQWLIEHPKKCKEMGNAGRELAEQNFNIENIIDKHMQIYQKLLKTC